MGIGIIILVVILLWINYVSIRNDIDTAKVKKQERALNKEIAAETKQQQLKNRSIITYTCCIDNKYSSIFKQFSTRMTINGKTYDDNLNGHITIPMHNVSTISLECKLLKGNEIVNSQRKTFNICHGCTYHIVYKTNPVPGKTYPNEIIIKQ